MLRTLVTSFSLCWFLITTAASRSAAMAAGPGLALHRLRVPAPAMHGPLSLNALMPGAGPAPSPPGNPSVLALVAILLFMALVVFAVVTALQRQGRKQADQKARESEARYRILFEWAPDAIAVYDAGLGRFVDVNACAEHLLGCTRATLLQMGLEDIMPPGQTSSQSAGLDIPGHLAKALAGEVPQFDCPVRGGDGRDLFCQVRLVRLPSERHRLIRVSLIDISERRKAEEALKTTNERLLLALEVGNAGLWEWNIRTDTVHFDERFHAILGYLPGDLPTTLEEWLPYHHPDDVPVWMPKAKAFLRGETDRYESQHRIRKKAGNWDWVFTRGTLESRLAPAGSPDLFIGFAMNVTEHRLAEEKVRQSEDKFSKIFMLSPDGFAITRQSDGLIMDTNLGFMTLLGWKRDEVVGKTSLELRFWDDPADRDYLVAELQAGRDVLQHEFRFRKKDGTIRPGMYSARPIQIDGQACMVFSMQDITPQKKAEEALLRTVTELERSNEELEQFASIASHDLQEPLRLIASYTQLLERRYKDQLDDQARQYIAYAVSGANRMQQLIQDMLAYSRASAQDSVMGAVDSRMVLDEALAILKQRIDESGARITAEHLPTVIGDHGQLVRVFQNLVENALKYHRHGHPPTAHVAAVQDGQSWIFAVADNGIGIEPQYRERIFEIFKRLHTGDVYPGTGIGLALCKRIILKHGGRIWVESQPDQGATFKFTLKGVYP